MFQKAQKQIEDIDSSMTNLLTKYASVLSYFGEDAAIPSHEFFTTLNRFIQV